MSENHPRPYNDVTEVVGGTPLIRLNRVARDVPGTIYVKCEFMNPGGSLKDRIGLAMVEAAEREGALKPGGVIVEATSGNTGLALAMVAAIRGYRCIFTMPDKMSQEKVQLLRAFGAEVVIVPTAVPPDHPEHYTVKAATIARETPGAILANQFHNPANPQAHYETTGPEIWSQTEGRITHFLAGSGTGGTISGVGRYLKVNGLTLYQLNGFAKQCPGYFKLVKTNGAGIGSRKVIHRVMTNHDGNGHWFIHRLIFLVY
ncbi:MAG: cysteine synthase family protein [Gemmatimonadetes bacterium]|nr:cysteine synthase family protein [Gemmatimonadota bacterium]